MNKMGVEYQVGKDKCNIQMASISAFENENRVGIQSLLNYYIHIYHAQRQQTGYARSDR